MCKFLLSIVFLGLPYWVGAQLIDFNRPNPYQQVFVDTDDFGAEYLSRLEKALTQTTSDTLKLKILNDLGYYYHTRNQQKALDYTKEGLKLARLKERNEWEGKLQITLAGLLLRMGQLDEAELLLKSAEGKISKNDEWLRKANLCAILDRRGLFTDATDLANEILHEGEESNNNTTKAFAYMSLGNLSWNQGNFETALSYARKAVADFEKSGLKSLGYANALVLTANSYHELKKNEAAINYYNQAIEMAEQYGFYNVLCNVYISLIDLNTDLSAFKNANAMAEDATRYANLLGNDFVKMKLWVAIGKLENQEKKYDKAVQSLQRSISLASLNFGDKLYLQQAFKELAIAYSGIQDYDKSYSAFLKYDQLKSEVSTSEAVKKMEKLKTEFEKVKNENTIIQQQNKLNQQRDRQIAALVTIVLLFVFLGGLYRIIRIKKKTNAMLQKQNAEKEFLLKEIHHRVKNNLEIVSGLLALQSAQLSDANAILAMREGQNRVQAMSMIHQRLYQGKNLAAIEMKEYFLDLSQHVLDSFGTEKRVTIECAMNKLELDIDTAVPLGLIVNELLTNAMKHAFPENRIGNIKIDLQQADESTLQLYVSDDGIGAKNKSCHNVGFGTQLIKLLVQQLNGRMKSDFNRGTHIYFEFKTDKAA
ncbi:MAG: histidine kinase dimerization/phosphoacceptor domain -containing protein [Flavobacteriaceae bacterium]|nr:histidine kinase dimerization/phosphoacceptor domain -containing protein [Flavobacteriaceae bacterium]